MVAAVRADLLSNNQLPAIGANLVLMDVGEDMCLVSATIYIEMVELTNKSVIRPWLGSVLRV